MDDDYECEHGGIECEPDDCECGCKPCLDARLDYENELDDEEDSSNYLEGF